MYLRKKTFCCCCWWCEKFEVSLIYLIWFCGFFASFGGGKIMWKIMLKISTYWITFQKWRLSLCLKNFNYIEMEKRIALRNWKNIMIPGIRNWIQEMCNFPGFFTGNLFCYSNAIHDTYNIIYYERLGTKTIIVYCSEFPENERSVFCHFPINQKLKQEDLVNYKITVLLCLLAKQKLS